MLVQSGTGACTSFVYGIIITHGRQEKVGNIAINDSFMLEAAIYFLLKRHFRNESYYVDLLELFH